MTEYRYPTDAAIRAIPYFTHQPDKPLEDHDHIRQARTAIDNGHSKGWFPDWVSERRGRERAYSPNGLLFLSFFFAAVYGARVLPTTAGKIVAEQLMEHYGEGNEYAAIRGGVSQKLDNGEYKTPDVWGFDQSLILEAFDELDTSNRRPLTSLRELGEALTLIPIKRLGEIVQIVVNAYDEQDCAEE